MWEEYSKARNGGISGGGLSLNTIWHVRADASYGITWAQPGARQLIAVRTIGGCGRFTFDKGDAIDVTSGTLLFIEKKHIRQYRHTEGTWHFWWFEFEAGGPLFFPLQQKMAIPAEPGEPELLRDLFRTLRKESPAQRSLASAGLAYQLHRWMAAVQEQQHASPNQTKVVQAIEAMYAHSDGSCRVATLARTAGLSERRFRQVFETVTGQTPKHFYDGIRLDLGRQLLLASPAKIEAVAERLGFSSPFHFSRSFRKRFGIPPSHIR